MPFSASDRTAPSAAGGASVPASALATPPHTSLTSEGQPHPAEAHMASEEAQLAWALHASLSSRDPAESRAIPQDPRALSGGERAVGGGGGGVGDGGGGGLGVGGVAAGTASLEAMNEEQQLAWALQVVTLSLPCACACVRSPTRAVPLIGCLVDCD